MLSPSFSRRGCPCELDVYVWPRSTRGQFCLWPCMSQSSPENQNEQDACVYKKKLILRNWLMQYMEIRSPKSAGRASRPKTQGRVTLSPKAAEKSLPDQGKLVVSLSGPSTDRMRPTHTREGHLHSSKSSDLNVDLISKTPSLKHPE